MESGNIAVFLAEIKQELTNILDYWMNYTIDNEHGGFYGKISHNNQIEPFSPKGSVLNARILWTFSVATAFSNNKKYSETAQRAYEYFAKHFIDGEYGGIFWTLNYEGSPLEDKKQIYSQAFALYALCEYYTAVGDTTALEMAKKLFEIIETHSFDTVKNGYFEAYSRQWTLLTDLRLSEKDDNEAKTMNTHLHLLEAYTKLYTVWKNDTVKKQLVNLLRIHIDKILNKNTWHLNLFFDEDWNVKSNLISFGHDIEASWLMCEAAEALENEELIAETRSIALTMAETVLTSGIMPDGSLIYEIHSPEKTDFDRHWWPQAEAMVGFINAFQVSNNQQFLHAAIKNWQFVKQYIVNPSGEWYWSVNNRYEPNLNDDKVGLWKCPYHNARACFELLKRLS